MLLIFLHVFRTSFFLLMYILSYFSQSILMKLIFWMKMFVLLSLLRRVETSKLTVSFSQYPASGSFFVSVFNFNFTDGAAFRLISKVIVSGSWSKSLSKLHAFVRGVALKRNWPFCPWTHIFLRAAAHHITPPYCLALNSFTDCADSAVAVSFHVICPSCFWRCLSCFHPCCFLTFALPA